MSRLIMRYFVRPADGSTGTEAWADTLDRARLQMAVLRRGGGAWRITKCFILADDNNNQSTYTKQYDHE